MRGLKLLGSQKSNDLKDALDAETEKTKLMEESMKQLDVVSMLYNLLPSKFKSFYDKLKRFVPS
jgi:hypothetical protein